MHLDLPTQQVHGGVDALQTGQVEEVLEVLHHAQQQLQRHRLGEGRGRREGDTEKEGDTKWGM